MVIIENAGWFLDFLSEGREALFKAKEEGRDIYDPTDDEIEAVDEMARISSALRRSIDPDDGFLPIYVD